MKLIFLGTNGWFDTATGQTPCVLLETKKCYVIFDAGFGLTKIDQYIKKSKPIFLFISHFHLDHICGLHTLPKFRFKQPLTILGPKGATKILKSFISHPFTASIKELPFKIKLKELKPGEYNKPFQFSCSELKHAVYNLGFRLEVDKKVITYCCDTGICKNDFILAKNSDVLIHECSFLTGQKTTWGHANPEQAARLAKKAKAKKLILTHFDASLYLNKKSRKEAERIAKKIFIDTRAAFDGLVVKI